MITLILFYLLLSFYFNNYYSFTVFTPCILLSSLLPPNISAQCFCLLNFASDWASPLTLSDCILFIQVRLCSTSLLSTLRNLLSSLFRITLFTVFFVNPIFGFCLLVLFYLFSYTTHYSLYTYFITHLLFLLLIDFVLSSWPPKLYR